MNFSSPTPVSFIKTDDAVALTDSMQRETLQIGQILLEMDKITLQDIEKILHLQKKSGVLFGDAAKQLSLISENDVQHALAYQADSSKPLPSQELAMPQLLVTNQPNSVQAESMRAIRTELILRGFPSDQNVLTITGINHHNETSLFTANLAALFSQLDKRTLLIDSNLRNPCQHRIFNLKNTYGLSEVLTGQTVIANAMTAIEPLPNLSLLPAGTPPPNPLELISMPRFGTTKALFSGQFDVVLYDAPGFLENTDTLMIAKHSDYVLLIVHKDQSRQADVEAISKQITSNGIKIIGSVLIDY